MMSFNVIDLLLLLLVLVNVWIGWQRGFILGLLDLVRWAASFLAALFFYRPVAGWLAPLTGWGELWNQPLAFLLVILGVSIVIQIIGAALLGRIPKKVHEHRANHAFGLLPNQCLVFRDKNLKLLLLLGDHAHKSVDADA